MKNFSESKEDVGCVGNIDSKPDHREVDFRDSEVIDRILEEHNPEEVEALRKFWNFTEEEVELYSQYAKQRKSVKGEAWAALASRKKNRPNPSPVELKLGMYIEGIEPQVKDAVLKLNSKGYETYGSGYGGRAEQNIWFSGDYFEGQDNFDDLKKNLQGKGVLLKVEPNCIRLIFERFYPLDEIKKIWDEVVDFLPEAPRGIQIKKRYSIFS